MPHKDGEAPPLALDTLGLERVREAFVAAAKRAERLGIDALELHCAHGYLLHQFLSPISNKRSDDYGGSLANRMRFPLEVFDAVRSVFPHDRPVGMRVSSTDWVEGGWDLAQTIEFCKALKARGVDWIDASSGGVSPLLCSHSSAHALRMRRSPTSYPPPNCWPRRRKKGRSSSTPPTFSTPNSPSQNAFRNVSQAFRSRLCARRPAR